MPGLSHNIELKARCADLVRAADVARELGADFVGTLDQVDTYFNVAHGRLKLRTIHGDRAELIWYQRPNSVESRDSRFRRVHIDDSVGLLTSLEGALGVWKVVRKSRNLWLWQNVRIHLDRVEGLGTFIEFEAVQGAACANPEQGHAQIRLLQDRFGILSTDLLAGSYSDLL